MVTLNININSDGQSITTSTGTEDTKKSLEANVVDPISAGYGDESNALTPSPDQTFSASTSRGDSEKLPHPEDYQDFSLSSSAQTPAPSGFEAASGSSLDENLPVPEELEVLDATPVKKTRTRSRTTKGKSGSK